MGMSLQDFDQCTPPEFERIFGMWRESQEAAYRTGWEQTRQLAACVLLPYVSEELDPRDVMEFEWDRESREQEPRKKTRREREAEKRHYEEVKKARGLS